MVTQITPFAGVWRADLAKSTRDPNHQFQSVTLHFDVSDDTVTLSHGGVNQGGQVETGTIVLHPDGKEYPLSTEIPEVVVVALVTRWVGTHRLEMVTRRSGREFGRASYEVSPDGKTLTATVAGIDASGRDCAQTIVFDRD